MKLIIFALLIALVCSACSQYQYAVIDSNIPKTAGRIVYDNDSLQITYKFAGNNGPATVGILNKLSTPIYVNWERSSVIIEGKSITRAVEAVEFGASSSATTSNVFQWSNTVTTDVNGRIVQTPQLGFIPPNSYIQSQPINLMGQFSEPTKELIPRRENGTAIKYENFDREDSPLLFRSYITLSATPDFAKPVVFDHEFWVSEVVQTEASPSTMKQFKNREDVYYTSSPAKGGGLALGLILIILSLGMLSAAGQNTISP